MARIQRTFQCREYFFPNDRGQTLAGYLYSFGENQRGIVVMAHGFGGGGQNSYMDCADLFARNGYLVFAYDATGTDRSGGESTGGTPQGVTDLERVVIHCTTNAQVSDRFAELIAHGLPKYRCATVTDGGVCVSLMVPDCKKVPGYVHQQNQDTRYYTLPDGTWLTVLSCEGVTDYCWYRPALKAKKK